MAKYRKAARGIAGGAACLSSVPLVGMVLAALVRDGDLPEDYYPSFRPGGWLFWMWFMFAIAVLSIVGRAGKAYKILGVGALYCFIMRSSDTAAIELGMGGLIPLAALLIWSCVEIHKHQYDDG